MVGPGADPSLAFDHENWKPLPPILARLVKAYYSVVLADFGIIDRTAYQNMSLFHTWAEEIPSLLNKTFGYSRNYISSEYFSWMGEQTSPARVPSTHEATIYTQYQCQIPQLKPARSLIMSVFLADLVFLRTLWWLLNLVTTWRLRRSDPQAMYCAGCLIHTDNKEAIIKEILKEMSRSSVGNPPKESSSLGELTATTQPTATIKARRASA